MISNFSDHGSNERTFLAWVRTSISIVGFGLATARLSSDPAPLWSEIAMLLSGVLVIIADLRIRQIHRLIGAEELLGDEKVPTDALLIFLIAALQTEPETAFCETQSIHPQQRRANKNPLGQVDPYQCNIAHGYPPRCLVMRHHSGTKRCH